MTRVAYPFVRPAVGTVLADVWMLRHGGEYRELVGHLDGWDYNTRLELTRDVRGAVSDLKNQARLPRSAQLVLAVGSFATATWSRQRLFHHVLSEEEEQLQVTLEVDGSEVAGTLELKTAVVLARRPDTDLPFAATLPGSVLWEDQHRVRLQGDAPLFPISVVSFERAGFAPHAPWHLDIGSDLSAPLHASLRLYLNTSATSIVSAFANAASPTDEQRAILRAAYADVARVMLEHAVNQEGLDSVEGEWESESLGYALRALLIRHFPGEDFSAVRLQRIEHPADFTTELLSKLRLFDA